MNFLKNVFMSIFWFCVWSVIYTCMFICFVWFLFDLQLPDMLVRLHKTWPTRMQQITHLTDTVKNMFSKNSNKIIIDTYSKQDLTKPALSPSEETPQVVPSVINQEETQENIKSEETTLNNIEETTQISENSVQDVKKELETIIPIPTELQKNLETTVEPSQNTEQIPQIISQKEAPVLPKELETQINPGTLVQK